MAESIHRRSFVKTVGAGAASRTLPALTVCTRAERPPNIVLILIDDPEVVAKIETIMLEGRTQSDLFPLERVED